MLLLHYPNYAGGHYFVTQDADARRLAGEGNPGDHYYCVVVAEGSDGIREWLRARGAFCAMGDVQLPPWGGISHGTAHSYARSGLAWATLFGADRPERRPAGSDARRVRVTFRRPGGTTETVVVLSADPAEEMLGRSVVLYDLADPTEYPAWGHVYSTLHSAERDERILTATPA